MKKNRKRTNFTAVFLTAAACFFLIPSADHAATVQLLTPEYLASGIWGPETGSWGTADDVGMKIKFTGDGKFESETMYGQDGCFADGTYSVKSGKLTLTMEKSKNEPFCGDMNSRKGITLKNGTLVTDAASPKYSRYILFKKGEVKDLYFEDDLKIWDYNSIVKEGEPLSIKGLNVLAMGMKKSMTTAVVKVRETPNVKGKEIHFSYEDYDTGETVTQKSISSNYGVTVLARTKEKDKVGKLNNYWYYVEFNGNVRGWVFGEFIKIF